MHKRILLALDGSGLAEQALPHALTQAERFHGHGRSRKPSQQASYWLVPLVI
jgi:hypothetical protein